MTSPARRLIITSIVCFLTLPALAQETPETNRKVAGGGITVKGYDGKQVLVRAKILAWGKTDAEACYPQAALLGAGHGEVLLCQVIGRGKLRFWCRRLRRRPSRER